MKKEIVFPQDINGNIVRLGDKVRGFGKLEFQNNFKIDRTPTVNVAEKDGVLYFGMLSAQSFPSFEIVERAVKKVIFITEDGVEIYDTMDSVITVDEKMDINYTRYKWANKNHKIFGTKEKAEEYISWFKRDLSVNDLLLADIGITTENLDKLQNIVKERL